MQIFEFTIGSITIAPTWYGLMYACIFSIFYYSLCRETISEWEKDAIFWYTILWVLIGGRIGYVLIYNFEYFSNNFLEIFMPWRWGMSFHWWAIWVVLSWFLLARKINKWFLQIADTYILFVPIWLLLGRIGNYINGELLWLPGYVGIGARMVNWVSYFPTPLLEGVLEWILLGAILLWKSKNKQYSGQLGVWFLGWYAIMRFFSEFFRTPDVQIGYILSPWLTLGHFLSIIMFVISVILHFYLRDQKSVRNSAKVLTQ